MLTPGQAQFAFVPLVVTAMSGVISLAMAVLNHGFAAGLVDAWLRSWPIAFAVALPAAWVILPGARRLLARLTRPQGAAPNGRQVGDLG